MSPSAPIGLWGYSGGGLASAWAAEMCGTYAPELDIVGAVLGAPVGDLGHTFRRLNGSFLAGLPALVIAALAHVYPDLDRVIKEHTNEEGRALLDALEKMTTVEAVLQMAGKNMGDYLDEPLEDILSTPEVMHVFDSIKLGAAVPTPPVLIVQAVHDYLIDVKDIDELADVYSAGGARVTYHRDAFNEHLILHPLSAPMTLRWLTDRFDGRPLTEHLIRTTWPTMFNPMTYVGMARLVKIAAKVITGRRIPHGRYEIAASGASGSIGRGSDCRSATGMAPRSSRASAAASRAYTSAAMPAGHAGSPRPAAALGRRTPAAPE